MKPKDLIKGEFYFYTNNVKDTFILQYDREEKVTGFRKEDYRIKYWFKIISTTASYVKNQSEGALEAKHLRDLKKM